MATTHSAVSPPPMRGFVVHWWGSCTRPLNIVGVVVKTVSRQDGEARWEETLILPVVFDIDFVVEPNGGLCVVDPTEGYWSDCDYTVLWCWWPEAEDDERFEAARQAFLARQQEAASDAGVAAVIHPAPDAEPGAAPDPAM